jgi:hypothetical protein
MIKNWKVKCNLLSPLCGEPPMIDSLLEYELSLRLGTKHAKKTTRATKLSELEKVPIPLAKRTIFNYDIYCCSDPILGNVYADYTERQSKRFYTDLVATILHESQRKMLLTSSGPYKARFVPQRIRLVDSIYWFVRGDRKEINKLLKKIIAVGHLRNIGYGVVGCWEYEEMENDYSIFAENKGGFILMKTIMIEAAKEKKCKGYKHGFSGAFPPYWHPENFKEVAIPC